MLNPMVKEKINEASTADTFAAVECSCLLIAFR